MNILKTLFGNYSEKEIKRITPIKEKVLSLEEEYKKLSDDELRNKTPEFKDRLAAGETLDDILPEAFAACREAADRVLGMRHFPVHTVNPAKALGLAGKKGVLAPGADADILLLDEDLNIDTTIALGRVLLREGRMQVFCSFEDC